MRHLLEFQVLQEPVSDTVRFIHSLPPSPRLFSSTFICEVPCEALALERKTK